MCIYWEGNQFLKLQRVFSCQIQTNEFTNLSDPQVWHGPHSSCVNAFCTLWSTLHVPVHLRLSAEFCAAVLQHGFPAGRHQVSFIRTQVKALPTTDSLKLDQMIFKNLISTIEKNWFPISTSNSLLPCREINSVYFENHSKHTNTVCRQNAVLDHVNSK